MMMMMMMRAFISFVVLVNLSSAYPYSDYGGYGGYTGHGGYPTYGGTYGTGVYPGGGYVAGPYNGYPVGKRDAPTQATSDVSTLYDAIESMIGKAVEGISVSELKSSSYAIKSMASALLKAGKGKIPNEDVEKLMVEIVANFSSIPALDILNSDVLGEEAYRVSVILRMLRECAERIQRLHAKGESYRHILKVVRRLAAKLFRIANRIGDLAQANVSNEESNKSNPVRRQGPWAFGLGGAYDPETGYSGGLNLGYKEGENDIGVLFKFNERTGGTFGISGMWQWK